jgi:hypothetical protein
MNNQGSLESYNVISESFEDDSNVTAQSWVQKVKHFEQMTWTEFGMQVEISDVHSPKALDSIRDSCEHTSNSNFQRDSQE